LPDRKEIHAQNCENHATAAEGYFTARVSACTAFANLGQAWEEGKKAAFDTGALEVDDQGKVGSGWYQGGEDPENQTVNPIDNIGVARTGGVLGLAGAIGAPAGAWVLVGAFGTASTGAAIGGLSGAAATSATAAWFGGGAVAAGGLGIAAAPFVLSGIGTVVGLGIMGIAALIAKERNNRNETAMDEADRTMAQAERRMDVNASQLKSLEQSANQISTKIIKATGVLEALRNDEAANLLDQAMREAEGFLPQLEKPMPNTRLYIGKPSPICALVQTTATRDTIVLKWEDPDGGESEIGSYRIIDVTGFFAEDRVLGTVKEPEFTHHRLESGKTYRYKIVPINDVAEGDSPETLEVRTQSP
jgi:hypothetical protein